MQAVRAFLRRWSATFHRWWLGSAAPDPVAGWTIRRSSPMIAGYVIPRGVMLVCLTPRFLVGADAGADLERMK